MREGMGGDAGGRRGSRYHNDVEAPGIMMHASRMPPVQLRLRLSNHGDFPALVEVPDFNSAIGNFVVQPEKITIAREPWSKRSP